MILPIFSLITTCHCFHYSWYCHWLRQLSASFRYSAIIISFRHFFTSISAIDYFRFFITPPPAPPPLRRAAPPLRRRYAPLFVAASAASAVASDTTMPCRLQIQATAEAGCHIAATHTERHCITIILPHCHWYCHIRHAAIFRRRAAASYRHCRFQIRFSSFIFQAFLYFRLFVDIDIAFRRWLHFHYWLFILYYYFFAFSFRHFWFS